MPVPFDAALRALTEKFNQPGGFDTIPIAEESLRPMIAMLAEIAAAHGPPTIGLILFDGGGSRAAPAEHVYIAAPIVLSHLPTIAKTYGERAKTLMAPLPREARHMDMMQVSPTDWLLYHKALYIPVEALGSFRH